MSKLEKEEGKGVKKKKVEEVGGGERKREKCIHPWSKNIWVIKVKFECHILSNYWKPMIMDGPSNKVLESQKTV